MIISDTAKKMSSDMPTGMNSHVSSGPTKAAVTMPASLSIELREGEPWVEYASAPGTVTGRA